MSLNSLEDCSEVPVGRGKHRCVLPNLALNWRGVRGWQALDSQTNRPPRPVGTPVTSDAPSSGHAVNNISLGISGLSGRVHGGQTAGEGDESV